MNKSIIQEKVINIVSTLLEKEEGYINESMHLNKDLGVDSLDKFVIAEEIENVFLINLSKNEVNELTSGTIKEMVDFIYNFLQGFENESNIVG